MQRRSGFNIILLSCPGPHTMSTLLLFGISRLHGTLSAFSLTDCLILLISMGLPEFCLSKNPLVILSLQIWIPSLDSFSSIPFLGPISYSLKSSYPIFDGLFISFLLSHLFWRHVRYISCSVSMCIKTSWFIGVQFELPLLPLVLFSLHLLYSALIFSESFRAQFLRFCMVKQNIKICIGHSHFDSQHLMSLNSKERTTNGRYLSCKKQKKNHF